MRLTVLATLLAVLLLAPAGRIFAAELLPQDVQNDMNKGIAYLKNKWEDHGSWSEYGGQDGGITCLCTMALLYAGEKPGADDEHLYLRQALEKIRKMRPTTTYVVALQTMVLCREDDPGRDQDIIARNVQWLQDTQITAPQNADRKGGWSYGDNALGQRASAPGDGSNSQFALLALYEAARTAEQKSLHVHINRDVWRLAHIYWTSNQHLDSGGWGYLRGLPPTGSMTCAGISSLVICNDMLHEPDAKVTGDKIDGCYRAPSEDRENIAKGIDWLRRSFTVHGNPSSLGGDNVHLWHYYYLYGLERAGRLSARRKIGEHDWYREGAKYLHQAIGAKTIEPCWQGAGFAETDPDITTSLALLFLSKGRWPALMAKVNYGDLEGRIRDADKQWNWHRNDVNNLTVHVENQWGMELTWQEMDVEKASVDDLLQVPVLFFSGNGNPLPDTEEKRQRLAQNLRDYIDRGGFIFADCEPCSDEFDTGFRKLMELVFREPEYRFKKLDASHPIWYAEEKVPSEGRLLLGIDYGCRTSVVYAPVDKDHPERPSLACLWELSRCGEKESFSKAVQDQIQGGLAIGTNVLAYAIPNRELKTRDVIPETVMHKVAEDPIQRGKLAIVKLENLGGCDAAPRALANLMEQAAQELKIRVETHPKMIAVTDPALFDHPIAFIHGRNAFRFTDAERKALREYVQRGGLLFGDAICGSEAFGESFRREMVAIFPKNPLVNIPANDPIWTSKYGGYDLKEVSRRDPEPSAPGQPPKSTLRHVPPELKGVRFGDRYGVIFSEFDLSCALEKQASADCRGYTREDAARIGLNVIRYGMQ